MIRLTSRDNPNFHLKIIEDRLQITVTLNVKPDMVPLMDPKTLWRVNKYHVHFQQAIVELSKMNEERILSIANKLLKLCMMTCRSAKILVIESQIQKVKVQPPKILAQS